MSATVNGRRTAVVLHAVAHQLGELSPVQELAELARVPDVAESLSHLGLQQYARSRLSVAELALASCLESLRLSRLDAAAIDALVFATSTLGAEGDCRRGLRWLHGQLELNNAHPIGLFGSECSNAPTAVRLAMDILLARGLNHALVVLADGAGGGSRVMDGFASVFSDGAASCLVSTDRSVGYAIESAQLHCTSSLWDVTAANNRIAYMKGSAAGMSRAFEACLADLACEREQLARVITGNYNRSVLNTFAFQLGIQSHQMYQDNLPRFAHCYAADLLINLHTLRASGGLGEGQMAVLLGTGLNTWGAVGIRALADDTGSSSD
jgi:3-oxoacyl-[acyl-carrier-protein] synthase III